MKWTCTARSWSQMREEEAEREGETEERNALRMDDRLRGSQQNLFMLRFLLFYRARVCQRKERKV